MENDRYIVNKFNEYKEFIKDKQVTFIIRKTERIVYGVYMLARFIPQEESLCSDIKKTTHVLLESVSRFVSSTGIAESDLQEAHANLQYMSALLSLSFISGYVSSSNIEIMKSEINYLHKHIEELSTRTASEAGHLHLKSDLFVVGSHKPIKSEGSMSFIKDNSTHRVDKMSFIKKPTQYKGAQVTKDVKSFAAAEEKGTRELRIIDVIRDKGVVSIKDISSVVFDVSEKTIQRTLQFLIDKGQIKKEGERRWAKYHIL